MDKIKYNFLRIQIANEYEMKEEEELKASQANSLGWTKANRIQTSTQSGHFSLLSSAASAAVPMLSAFCECASWPVTRAMRWLSASAQANRAGPSRG